MRDQALPEAVQGLYFGGGFPEVFAAALTENLPARQSVQAAIHGNANLCRVWRIDVSV
jgi:cobyrinic acid a,c-diamide synthase